MPDPTPDDTPFDDASDRPPPAAADSGGDTPPTGGPWTRLRSTFTGFSPFDAREQLRLIAYLLRWIALGSVTGVLAGLASALFIESLNWATRTRLANPWLLWLLPLAGLFTGYVYLHAAGRAAEGNALIIDEIHDPKAWVPRRMAPLIFVFTIITQLFGGSAGREGTALQMSGSLTDLFSRTIRLRPSDRRILLIAALSGGFGAMFGVPLAGALFGLEVQSVGRIRYEALVPALAASIVGDQLVRGLGIDHGETSAVAVHLSPGLLAKVALAGLVFGLFGALFIEVTHIVKRALEALLLWAPARPLLGGVLVIALVLVVGNRDYLGLSVPLAAEALTGAAVGLQVPFLKLLFTSVTIGSGFQGGEVTPLFVMGATLGGALGHLLGVPPELLAAVGFVAVFAGAANTPITCTIMAAELFGAALVVPAAIACVVSYVFSSHRSIYGTQRVDVAKTGIVGFGPDTRVHDTPRSPWRWPWGSKHDPTT